MTKKITILSQYIKDLSFENYAAQKNKLLKKKPTVHIDIKIKKKQLKDNISEITLIVLLEARNAEEKIFLIELSYATSFTVRNVENPINDKRIFFVDCPNIMFPFVRQLLFTITSTSGFPPISLDYIDFAELYDSKLKN